MEMTPEAWRPALNSLSLELSNNSEIILQVEWGFIRTPAIDDNIWTVKTGTASAGSRRVFPSPYHARIGAPPLGETPLTVGVFT